MPLKMFIICSLPTRSQRASKGVISFLLAIVLLVSIIGGSCTNQDHRQNKSMAQSTNLSTFYVGTYTRPEGHVNGNAKGIYKIQVNESTGEIKDEQIVAQLINPSFLAYAPNKKYLYAVSELAQVGEPVGFLYAFKVGIDSLELINRLPTGGQAPCHVSIDQTGKFAFVANYVGGVVSMYRIKKNGSLAITDKRQFTGSSTHAQQDSPHLHSVIISPDNTLAVIPDKGTDKIWLFRIEHENGKLLPTKQAFLKIQNGAGPRHLVWSKDGGFCYVINELDNTINVIAYNQLDTTFTSIQTISTLPSDYEGESYCADIRLHPTGKFLYGSNRGHDSIALFAVNTTTGKLTFIGTESTRGTFPRNFRIDKQGQYLYVANQNSRNITSYIIDEATGQLKFTGFDFKIGTPVCIEF